jgi:cell division protein FtsL
MEKAHLRRTLHIVGAIVVVLLAVGLYKAKSDAAQTEARVRALQAQIEDTEADLRALRAEIARRESPERVAELAEQRLGLVVGSEAAALPERAIAQRLPAPQREREKSN